MDPIFEKMIAICSDGYKDDPNTVLERAAQFFVIALSVHLGILQKINREKKGLFNAKANLRGMMQSLEDAVLAKLENDEKLKIQVVK